MDTLARTSRFAERALGRRRFSCQSWQPVPLPSYGQDPADYHDSFNNSLYVIVNRTPVLEGKDKQQHTVRCRTPKPVELLLLSIN